MDAPPIGSWVTVGDSDHVWQVWDEHPKHSYVWLADGTRWVAAPIHALRRAAPAASGKPSSYTSVIVRTARKIHACDEDGCDTGIWPGQRYVLAKAFPGHHSGIADGTIEHGPRPVTRKFCATHARKYEDTNLEGL